MKINNRFTQISSNQSNNKQKGNCPKTNLHFGSTSTLADQFVEACPAIEDIVGREIFPYIKGQKSITLNFKTSPTPHFILNWAKKELVPDRFALSAFLKGGFKFEISSEKLKDFLYVSKIMVHRSDLMRMDKLERLISSGVYGKSEDFAHKFFRRVLINFKKDCPPEEYAVLEQTYFDLLHLSEVQKISQFKRFDKRVSKSK